MVGFFREMPHGEPTDPSLTAARTHEPAPLQEKIAVYLDAGNLMFASPGLATHVLDGHTVIGPVHHLTDGWYVWPGDLAYYAAGNGFTVPSG